jgi:type I restriction enzyme S subunit
MANKLPKGWILSTLADVGSITTGITPSKNIRAYYEGGSIPFVKPPDLGRREPVIRASDNLTEEGFKKAKPIPINSIMVCCIGSLGKIGIAGMELATNQQINSIFFDEKKVEFRYGYYYTLTIEKYMNIVANKAVVSIINKSAFSNFPFPLPPLSEQRRIVAKLDSLFARIDRAVALVEQNIANAQHLIASMLNDVFDGLDCAKMKLQDSCIINPPKSEVKSNGNLEVSFLPMADLNAHQIDFIPKHTKRIAEVYAGYTYFKNGDVLLAKVTPCFENGKAGLADNLVNGIGFGSSEYIVLRAKQVVLPAYVYYNLTNSEFLRQGAQNMSGAVGLKRVTKDFIFNYEIPIPSIDVQENVVKYFTNQTTKLSELTSRLEERLTELRALKSSLLDSAFKGEL